MNDDIIFRQEAIDHHTRARLDGDALLRLPTWTQWTYRLVLVAALAATAFVAFATVPEYVEGPGLVRARQRVSVTAVAAGVVASVEVERGQRVAAGDILVRLRSVEEQAEIVSLQREFDTALVGMLANPIDHAVRQSVGGLRAQKDILQARLEQRLVRASSPGTVGDIRVRAGQTVAPGDFVASIVGEGARFYLVALLPGQHRPSLREGQPLRVELTGYQYAYQTLTIGHIEDDIIGPSEVRRVLGPEIGDAIAVSAPVVVVQGDLAGTSFASGGVPLNYFDGMHAQVRARVRSQNLLVHLIPGLKVVTEPAQ